MQLIDDARTLARVDVAHAHGGAIRRTAKAEEGARALETGEWGGKPTAGLFAQRA
jgi:hypothetical protein